MEWDHTTYPVPGGDSKAQRESTPSELATWMNKLAEAVTSNVYHWVTEGRVHFIRHWTHLGVEHSERGVL